MLVEARKKAGLTQAQVAEQLGLVRSHVAQIESGALGLYLLDFVALSKILGVDPCRFLRHLKNFTRPSKDNRAQKR
jgi:transcriptional regulator with XRE-family HTH domain